MLTPPITMPVGARTKCSITLKVDQNKYHDD